MRSTRAGRSMCMALAFAFLSLAGCFGMQQQEIMPAADIAPLSPEVSLNTLVSLVTFAVKDRQCRAVPEDTTPRMHPALRQPAYMNCIYVSTATECDATIADLQTMRTLMERNPRLSAIAEFVMVINRINEECRAKGRKVISEKVVRPWPARRLQQCPRTQDQPVLIAIAIGVRPPINLLKNLGDEFTEWANLCGMAKGLVFLSDHCSISVKYSRLNAPPNYEKLGIEGYLCYRS